MGLRISTTADCKKIVITVIGAVVGEQNSVTVTNGDYSYSYNFSGGSSNTRVVTPSQLNIPGGEGNGVFTVAHIANGDIVQIGAVLLACNVLCCLAAKMEGLIGCECEDSKCSEALNRAMKIFLLYKTASAELATSGGAGSIQSVNAIISNAEKKYNKAVEMCGGHCGCNS